MESQISNIVAVTRKSPISPAEREALLGLIKEYEHIIMDRRTDGKFVAVKKHTWHKITETLNSLNLGPKRSEQQIKKVWERLKVK